MKYILDTHVWIWLVEASDRMSRRTADVLMNEAHTPLGISAISPWEVAKKLTLGKLSFSMPGREWILRSAGNAGIAIVPLTPEISWEANNLPHGFHNDPADQLIVASARVLDLTLVTCDRRVLEYRHVKTLSA